jgi:hypothetical protein
MTTLWKLPVISFRASELKTSSGRAKAASQAPDSAI